LGDWKKNFYKEKKVKSLSLLIRKDVG
jgi:hypothetical protein